MNEPQTNRKKVWQTKNMYVEKKNKIKYCKYVPKSFDETIMSSKEIRTQPFFSKIHFTRVSYILKKIFKEI